jgi:hypothetical protein
VPVLYESYDWVQNKKNANRGVVDSILRDPDLARLYWAMSRMDGETGRFLWQSMGLKKLILAAPVLDFYGSQISVRSGRVLVPGGPQAESAWRDLVGANPRSAADFVTKLVSKDSGWLAAYFDTLSRVGQSQQAYFTSTRHIQRIYDALRGHDLTPIPTRHSFRPDPGLFLLEARLKLDADGKPHIPGDIEVWKSVLRHKTDSRLVHEWGEKAGGWNNPDQVIEGMVGVSRYPMPDGPVFNFLMLTEIDRGRDRGAQLSVPAARLLAEKFSQFGDQYPVFAEFHALNDESIIKFISTAEGLNQISDRLTKTDALGMLQANLGLWQILARQGQIPDARWNDSWQKILAPFATLHTSDQVYAAGRAALGELLRAATGRTYLPEDQIFALLAGPEQFSKEGQQLRGQMASRMHQVIDDQRLVSLDTLIQLGDGLDQMAKGKDVAESLIPLAGELREFEMPKPLFTKSERTEFAAGVYSNRHTALQMRTDLIRVLKSPNGAADLAQAHGLLTPFFRDTLVGLNYAYYEPPGDQRVLGGGDARLIEEDVGAAQLRGVEFQLAGVLHGRTELLEGEEMGVEPSAADHVAAGRRQRHLAAAGKQGTGQQDRGPDPRAQIRIEIGGANLFGMDRKPVAAAPFGGSADRADQFHQRFGVADARDVFQCDRLVGQKRRRDNRQRGVLVAGRLDGAPQPVAAFNNVLNRGH